MAKDTVAILSFRDIESPYQKYLQGLRILTEGQRQRCQEEPLAKDACMVGTALQLTSPFFFCFES